MVRPPRDPGHGLFHPGSSNDSGPYLASLTGFFLVSVAKPGTTAVLYSPEFQGSVSYNCSVRWVSENEKH